MYACLVALSLSITKTIILHFDPGQPLQTGALQLSIYLSDSEYDPESALKYKNYLSDFQVEKFTFMFNSLFDYDKVI